LHPQKSSISLYFCENMMCLNVDPLRICLIFPVRCKIVYFSVKTTYWFMSGLYSLRV
jgi:hypothetical protein